MLQPCHDAHVLLLPPGAEPRPYLGGSIPAADAAASSWMWPLYDDEALVLIYLPRATLLRLLPGMGVVQSLLYGAAGNLHCREYLATSSCQGVAHPLCLYMRTWCLGEDAACLIVVLCLTSCKLHPPEPLCHMPGWAQRRRLVLHALDCSDC